MGGQGLGDIHDQTIGGQCKAREIKKMHAIGASPREDKYPGKATVSDRDPSAC